MVGLPFLARMRSSGIEPTPNRRPIASIAPHLFKKLAERAKETFGSTSVPETLLARQDAKQFKPKKIHKGKGLVLKVASNTSEVANKTPGLALKVASSTSEVADETPVLGKVDFVLKLKGNGAKEFVSKDSELTYTRAISAAQYVQRQFELGSIMQLIVITFTMVVCCIRAAKCCRTLMTRISSGKQTDEKAIHDHGDDAKGKAWKCAQKKSLESSVRPFLSSEKELKVAVTAREEVGETDRKQEDASTHEVIGSSVCASIDSEEGMKEDDQHLVSLGIESVNEIPCESSLVAEGDNENECFDQQATSLVSKWIRVNQEKQGLQEEQGTFTVDKGTERGIDTTPVSLETMSVVEASPASLWGESSLGREQEKRAAIDALGTSLQSKLDDDGEEEGKKEDFESKSLRLVMGRAKHEQPLFVMTDWSPRAPDNKGPVEVSDPEQLFSEPRPAIEENQNPLLRDCPSLASATSLDSSITSDGEMTNYTGGSSISSGSPGSSGRSVKRISFCPSPPQVREYERYDMDRVDPSIATSDTPLQFNNLNKKRRMLRKNLDELNGDGLKVAVPIQGTQRVTRMAKQLGQAFLVLSASVLTQRR
jgi:hypothetical protein